MMFIGKNTRAQTEVKGITYEQLYKCFCMRLEYLAENYDPDAVAQNFCCEIEKLMGIYPNVPGLERRHDP
jgi:hypothetical protein